MHRLSLLLFLIISVSIGCASSAPSSVSTPTHTDAPTSTLAPTRTDVPTPTPTLAPTQTNVPTPTPTLAPTHTKAPTPTPTLAPTATLSPEAQIYRILEHKFGEDIWGARIYYSPNPNEIKLVACIGEGIPSGTIAKDFVNLVVSADPNKDRWYLVQLHRCDRSLHGGPYQIRRADCVDTIAYAGWAGNTREAHRDGSLKQSRGPGGVKLDNPSISGGSIGHCLP